MHVYSSSLVAGAALALVCAAPQAKAQFFLPVPVAITYSCPAQTGTLPACKTSYTLPSNKLLIIQNISGSATPINPNAAGNFATGQASLIVGTSLGGSPLAPNIVGPNYALANTAVWFFNTPTTLYTDTVPAIANNNGPVVLQGYIVTK